MYNGTLLTGPVVLAFAPAPSIMLKFSSLLIFAVCLSAENRATWMKDAKFGVMTHYLADWQAKANNLTMSVDEWNRADR